MDRSLYLLGRVFLTRLFFNRLYWIKSKRLDPKFPGFRIVLRLSGMTRHSIKETSLFASAVKFRRGQFNANRQHFNGFFQFGNRRPGR